MWVQSEKRSTERVNQPIPIMLEYSIGNYCSAIMMNHSSHGMYLEADCYPLTGSEIMIGIGKCPYVCRPAVYQAEVKWRDELNDDEAIYLFGFGVKLKETV